MSKTPDRQTSVLMDETVGSYRNVMQPDTTSGGRLLSASDDSRGGPRTKMTRSARQRVRVVLIVMLVVVLATLITVIAILATGAAQASQLQPTFEDADKSSPLLISSKHARCKDDVNISTEDTHQDWRHYDKKSSHWQEIPNIKHTGFVLISPRLRLEAGYSGVLVSMQLPGNNTRFHVMAVSSNFNHSRPAILKSGAKKCDSVAIDDRRFFTGDEIVFRVYVYYLSHFRLHDMKFTVTSLTTFPRFQSLTLDEPETKTNPKFTEIRAGQRDHCSLELSGGIPTCNWWNTEDGDNADFVPDDWNDCITRGVDSHRSAVYFLGLEQSDVKQETRSLLVSPIIKRETESVLFTMWYIYHCVGTTMRIHRIPATQPFTQKAFGEETVFTSIVSLTKHHQWKFHSLEIPLPDDNQAYQIVIEGILTAGNDCTSDVCYPGSRRFPQSPLKPFLGLDSLSLELLYEKCHPLNGSDILNCGFQTKTNSRTMCEWISSVPENTRFYVESGQIPRAEIADWRIESSGAENSLPYGATKQHLKGRGFILSFDSSGKYQSEGNVRTPLLIASDTCSCNMSFLYLMRGIFSPRMQVNVIYGNDTRDETREREPQWSLFGHQNQDWSLAVITINLRKSVPFQLEIRVTEITDAQSDIHFDDLEFVGCALTKYVPPSST